MKYSSFVFFYYSDRYNYTMNTISIHTFYDGKNSILLGKNRILKRYIIHRFQPSAGFNLDLTI